MAPQIYNKKVHKRYKKTIFIASQADENTVTFIHVFG